MAKRPILAGLVLVALTEAAAASQNIALLSPSQVSGIPLPADGTQTFTFKINVPGLQQKFKNPVVTAKIRVVIDSSKITVMQPYALLASRSLSPGATSTTFTMDDFKGALHAIWKNYTYPWPVPMRWSICAGPDPDGSQNQSECDVTWFSYTVPPTPTPTAPDLAVSVEPDFSTVWPTAFRVRNLGAHFSEATTLDVKVEVLQGDLDVVKQNCHPRITDFADVVPPIVPGNSAVVKPPPPAPMKIRFRAGLSGMLLGRTPGASAGPTPTPNPVKQVVACQYEITVSLAKNHNLNDKNHANDTLTRTIHVDVPLP